MEQSKGIDSKEPIPLANVAWARIFKRLRSPGIDSKESISPADVAGVPVQKIGLSYRPARLGIDSWAP
jgi:hypothetical protein